MNREYIRIPLIIEQAVKKLVNNTPAKGDIVPDHGPVNIFISYSHEDEKLCEELIKHLAPWTQENVIKLWRDRGITAGTEWRQQISKHLNEADIILLLISSDFIASNYCYNVEMKYAMERHKEGTARVIPIILRPCQWQTTWAGELQALPKDGKPITNWQNRAAAFQNVVEGIRKVVKELRGE